jgi:nucleotide-binding universal stress UspA family protein
MTILVPLDGSEAAEAAVPVAVRLATKARDTIVLVHVVSRHREAPSRLAAAGPSAIDDARSYLAAVKRHRCPTGVAIETAVWFGAPGRTIVRAAAACHADVIVMSTWGRRRRARAPLADIAEAVLRNARTDVIVVEPPRGGVVVERRHVTPATATG